MARPHLHRWALIAALGGAPLTAVADVQYTLFTHPDLVSLLPGFDALWGTGDEIFRPSPNPLGAASLVFDNFFEYAVEGVPESGVISFSLDLGFQTGSYTLAEPLGFPFNSIASWDSTVHRWRAAGNYIEGTYSEGNAGVTDYQLAAAPPSTVIATTLLSFSTTIHVEAVTSGDQYTFGPSFGIALFNDGLRDDIRLIGDVSPNMPPSLAPGFPTYASYLMGLLEESHPDWTAANFYLDCKNADCTLGSATFDYSTDSAAILPFNVATGVFTEGVVDTVYGFPQVDLAYAVGTVNGGGMLAVLGGATLETDALLIAADTADTVGTVLVAGPGSVYEVTSGIGVGELGDGRLDISEGGRVVSGNGTENFADVPGRFMVGVGGGSRGLAQVRGVGSELAVTGETFIGNGFVTDGFGIDAPTSGEVHVTDGGVMTVDGDLRLGVNGRATGLLQVDGPGSRVEFLGFDRQVYIGNEGSGRVEVSHGGQVLGASSAVVGVRDASELNIDGPGSLFELSGTCVLLCNGGFGPGMGIGFFEGSGTVAVTNGGSLSFDGEGTPGAYLAVGGAYFAFGATSHGSLYIDGPGSRATLSGPNSVLDVGGGDSFGTISLTNGGELHVLGDAAGTILAGTGGSTGRAEVLIDGSGSLLDAGRYMNIGRDVFSGGSGGTAVVTVSNGGTLDADFVYIGANSTLNGNEGTVIGTVENHGTLSPGSSPGVLHVLGDLILAEDGVLLLEIGGLIPGIDHDVLDVSGTLTLGGTLQIVLLDGFQPASNAPLDLFNAGTLLGGFANIIGPEGYVIDLDEQGGVRLSAVPLPGALLFLMSGLGVMRLRRTRSARA